MLTDSQSYPVTVDSMEQAHITNSDSVLCTVEVHAILQSL